MTKMFDDVYLDPFDTKDHPNTLGNFASGVNVLLLRTVWHLPLIEDLVCWRNAYKKQFVQSYNTIKCEDNVINKTNSKSENKNKSNVHSLTCNEHPLKCATEKSNGV